MVRPGIIRRDPSFDPKLFCSKKGFENSLPFNVKNVLLFGFARTALYEGLRILDIKAGENVLVPEYVCNVVMAPMHRLNIKAKFYQVDNSLRPVWSSLEQKIDKDTKALLIVDYFGFPNDLEAARQLCDRRRIYLIEDSAHSFLSSYKGNPLGSTGDISFFSFRKMAPVPDGAALVVNNQSLAGRLSRPGYLAQNDRGARFIAKSLLEYVLDHFLSIGRRHAKETDFEALRIKYACEEYNIETYFTKFSSCSYLFMNHFNFGYIGEQRRKAYHVWLDHFSGSKTAGIKIVFPLLDDGVVPSSFPLLADNRKEFISKMGRDGIECFPWPFLPGESSEGYLSKHTVCLPVSPCFNPGRLGGGCHG